MLTIDLEKKLLAGKASTVSNLKKEQDIQNSLLDNVKNILEAKTNEDDSILRSAGFASAISNAVEVRSKAESKLSQLKSLKSDRIFTIAEIKSLAIQYQLRFLPTSYYQGVLPSDLAAKLKEAKDFLGARIAPDYSYRGDTSNATYYILAPQSSFALEVRPVDPLLFIRLTDETFYLTHKWGNDLSIFRSKTLKTIGLVLLSILVVYSLYTFIPKDHDNNVGSAILVGILLLFGNVIAYFTGHNINKDNWNSKFRN